MTDGIPNPKRLAEFAETDAILRLLHGIRRVGKAPGESAKLGSAETSRAPQRAALAPAVAFVGESNGKAAGSAASPPEPDWLITPPQRQPRAERFSWCIEMVTAGPTVSESPSTSGKHAPLPNPTAIDKPPDALSFNDMLKRINWRNRPDDEPLLPIRGSSVIPGEDAVFTGHDDRGLPAWPADFLRTILQTLQFECGTAGETLLRKAGKNWGRRLASGFSRRSSTHHGIPFGDLPITHVHVSLASMFERFECGHVEIDFRRHQHGLVELAVTDSLMTASQGGACHPDYLQAGIFAGFFAELAGTELECLQTDRGLAGSAPARYVIGVPERLNQLTGDERSGQPHDCVIAILESIEV
jgi:predicted hydrocarbon binding protein